MRTLLVVTPSRVQPVTAAGHGGQLHVLDRWHSARSWIAAGNEPAAVLVDINTVKADAVTVEELHTLNRWCPTAIWLSAHEPMAIQQAWPFARANLSLVTDGRDQARQITELLRDRSATLATHLDERLDPDSRLARRVIGLLQSDVATLTWPTYRVAETMRMARSSLYAGLVREGSQTVEDFQLLFRLVRAARVLQTVGSTERAARAAFLSDSRSLRRAFLNRLQLSIADIRSEPGVGQIVDQWLTLSRRNVGRFAHHPDVVSSPV